MPDMALTIEHRPTAGGHHLTVAGELDYTNAAELDDTLAGLAFHHGSVLTLDLSRLGFCDSTGLSALISAYRLLEAAGGRATITAIDHNVARILSITGMDHFFGLRSPRSDTA